MIYSTCEKKGNGDEESSDSAVSSGWRAFQIFGCPAKIKWMRIFGIPQLLKVFSFNFWKGLQSLDARVVCSPYWMIPKKKFSTLKVSWGVIDTRVFVPRGFRVREIYNSSRAAVTRKTRFEQQQKTTSFTQSLRILKVILKIQISNF